METNAHTAVRGSAIVGDALRLLWLPRGPLAWFESTARTSARLVGGRRLAKLPHRGVVGVHGVATAKVLGCGPFGRRFLLCNLLDLGLHVIETSVFGGYLSLRGRCGSTTRKPCTPQPRHRCLVKVKLVARRWQDHTTFGHSRATAWVFLGKGVVDVARGILSNVHPVAREPKSLENATEHPTDGAVSLCQACLDHAPQRLARVEPAPS
mmetsp:Transcript_9574/g.24627  ORF Transcript_9574/g.24627 Transcript_9574/m.24627 type:complete len:209 (-) Transcript_9574:72-698(-)